MEILDIAIGFSRSCCHNRMKRHQTFFFIKRRALASDDQISNFEFKTENVRPSSSYDPRTNVLISRNGLHRIGVSSFE